MRVPLRAFLQLAGHVEPSQAGHPDIEERDVGRVLPHETQGIDAVVDQRDQVEIGPQRGKPRAQNSTQVRFVVGDQRGGHSKVQAASGNTTRTSVPGDPSGSFRRALPVVQRGEPLAQIGRIQVRTRLPAQIPGHRRPPRPPGSPPRRARSTLTHPPCIFGSSPCLIAFSTSGWISSGGRTDGARSSAGPSIVYSSRAPIRDRQDVEIRTPPGRVRARRRPGSARLAASDARSSRIKRVSMRRALSARGVDQARRRSPAC